MLKSKKNGIRSNLHANPLNQRQTPYMAIHMAMVMSMTMCGVYLFDLGYLVLEISVETCVGCWGDSSTLGIESNGKQMSGLVWSRLWAEGPRMFMFVFECSIAGKILYCLYLWLALRLDKIAPSGVEWVGFACASRLIAGDRGGLVFID